MNYYELQIHIGNFDTWHDICVAYLAELDYESFVEESPVLKAYIQELKFDGQALQNLMKQMQEMGADIQAFDLALMPQQNWNATWEAQFEPVFIGEQLRIVAPFHKLPAFSGIEIVILPKMSFGTGHHPTTFSMIQLMQRINFKAKTVYDFGTGTGILAILAEKLGANKVLAVDNDDWCIENANENIQNNASKVITIQKVASALQKEQYDIVLANVNRHIIEANMDELTQIGKPGGILVLSGLLIEDQSDMIDLARSKSWIFQEAQPLDGWVSLLFKR
jgi:ribosomal protein L11 methyltransferase